MTLPDSVFQFLRRWWNYWRLPRFANDDEMAEWFETHDIPDLPLANVSTGSAVTVRPILWCDFNVPADVEGRRCARADAWMLRHGDPVRLEDDSGEGLIGRVSGEPWTGPSGTRYVLVTAEC